MTLDVDGGKAAGLWRRQTHQGGKEGGGGGGQQPRRLPFSNFLFCLTGPGKLKVLANLDPLLISEELSSASKKIY